MKEYSETQGRTTIDPGVLIKIAKLTTLGVPGVSKMASGPHHVESLLRKNYSDGVFVFILPPSIDVLKERLKGRGSEKSDIIKIRFQKAIEEIKENKWYDYAIFNDTIRDSVDIMKSICIAEKNKRKRLKNKINKLF